MLSLVALFFIVAFISLHTQFVHKCDRDLDILETIIKASDHPDVHSNAMFTGVLKQIGNFTYPFPLAVHIQLKSRSAGLKTTVSGLFSFLFFLFFCLMSL